MAQASSWHSGLDPFAEMRRVQDQMNRLFADLSRPTADTPFPLINLWLGEDSAVVTAELPGVRDEDLELSARDNALTIRGKLESSGFGEKASWHRQERAYGDFARVVQLPFRVDPERIKARLLNGVLEVELPRPETDKPRRIRVNAS